MATGHGSKLPRKKEQAVAALISLPTIRAAAAAVGVDESTLRAWMQQDEFKSAYDAARKQLVDDVLAGLQRAGSEAVACLVRNLNCEEAAVEVRAAGQLLANLARFLDNQELTKELAEIKDRIEELRQGGIGHGEQASGHQAPGGSNEAGQGDGGRPERPGPDPAAPGAGDP